MVPSSIEHRWRCRPPALARQARHEYATAAAVSRLVLAAQEDLRREIARAMHDGPAQSLTNIVLQAQIVERLVDRDPLQAKTEVEQLVGMVQRTLDAIKTFIFDVRPMVLDDLGLVPTLRRVARDRGRRSQVPIEFESYGPDRRLPMDVESALFRLIDETVTGFLSCHPDRISIRFEWATGRTEARISARREELDEEPEGDESIPTDRHGKALERDLPEALKAMIDETRAAKVRRAERITQPLTLPTNTWREVQQRSDTIALAPSSWTMAGRSSWSWRQVDARPGNRDRGSQIEAHVPKARRLDGRAALRRGRSGSHRVRADSGHHVRRVRCLVALLRRPALFALESHRLGRMSLLSSDPPID